MGASAAAVYRDLILLHQRVTKVRVRRYRPPPSLQDRLTTTDSGQSLVRAALMLRERIEVPFWQALMIAIRDSECVPDRLLDAAMFHEGSGICADLTRAEVERGELESHASTRGSLVALDSLLELEGREAHLALMDFRVTPSDANTRLVVAICRRLLSDGFVVLASGRSYHVCGTALQVAEERIAFLGRSLLFSPIVDDRYVAHQLSQPSSSLRISASVDSELGPHVVAIWYPD